MIKAAMFDVYGTCVDWHTGIMQTAEKVLSEKNMPIEKATQIAQMWRSLYDPYMEEVRSGRRPYVTLDVIQLENLEVVLQRTGLCDVLDDDDRAALNRGWDELPAWTDTVAALAQLKHAMPIAACSNGSRQMMARLEKFNGIDWNMIAGADTAHNYKPAAEVYLNSCSALGFEPHEVVMVACHPDDLDEAQKFGLKTAYFPRPKEWGDQALFEPDPMPQRFTFFAQSLPELVIKLVRAAA